MPYNAFINSGKTYTYLQNVINSASSFYFTRYDHSFKKNIQLDSSDEICDLRDDLKVVFEFSAVNTQDKHVSFCQNFA